MNWQDEYRRKLVSSDYAASLIRSGDRILSTTVTGVPVDFLEALGKRYKELTDVLISSQLLLYPFEWLKKDYVGHIGYMATFLSAPDRLAWEDGNVNVLTFQFSKTRWIIDNRFKPTVMISEVAPPDERGYMSLGAAGTIYGKYAAQAAERVILQVNPNQPYVHGGEDAFIHVSEADFICLSDKELFTLKSPPVSEEEEEMARHMLPYIEDGSTIQLGLGGVANAVGFSLRDHRHLGVHSEMLTDSMMALIKSGAIDCSMKTINNGVATVGFTYGTKELYEFVDNNKFIDANPIYYIADPNIIGQHENFVSINSCMACDILGQVSSESIGFNQYSATGGQLDFIRGAALSKGGRSFLCMKSLVKKKDGTILSKISSSLSPGTAVTAPRTDVDCIVTEYGVAEVRDKTISERAKAIIAIAHPNFREAMTYEAKKNHIIF